MSDTDYLVNEEEPPAFCRTPAADAMLSVIELAQEMESMGAIVGAPGVGKTTTLRWYAESDRGVAYCVMNPAQSSMTAMLVMVCHALGAVAGVRSGSAALYEIARTAIEWERVQVLLVDEAQHLNDRCLDVLRCLHDETGVALVFAGNESLRNRFNNTQLAAFAQFTSRLGPRVELDMPTVADVATLARHAGCHHPKAIAFLERYIVGTAGLRKVSALLRAARKIAGERDIGQNHLRLAASGLRLGKE